MTSYLAILWLKSAALLYAMIGVALYLDQERDVIRRHCRSERMLLLKFTLAPLVIVYIALRILVALPKYWWAQRMAGCFAGNRPPMYVPPKDRTPATPKAPPARQEANCAAACCCNSIERTVGPNSLVRDDHADFNFEQFPILSEAHLCGR